MSRIGAYRRRASATSPRRDANRATSIHEIIAAMSMGRAFGYDAACNQRAPMGMTHAHQCAGSVILACLYSECRYIWQMSHAEARRRTRCYRNVAPLDRDGREACDDDQNDAAPDAKKADAKPTGQRK